MMMNSFNPEVRCTHWWRKFLVFECFALLTHFSYSSTIHQRENEVSVMYKVVGGVDFKFRLPDLAVKSCVTKRIGRCRRDAKSHAKVLICYEDCYSFHVQQFT